MLLMMSLTARRTPHGVRELKRIVVSLGDYMSSRTPHGVRELKPSLD